MAHRAAGSELREKRGEIKKEKLKKLHCVGLFLVKSTGHKNRNNSRSGKKWQLKIGQNMQKTCENPNFCFKNQFLKFI